MWHRDIWADADNIESLELSNFSQPSLEEKTPSSSTLSPEKQASPSIKTFQ